MNNTEKNANLQYSFMQQNITLIKAIDSRQLVLIEKAIEGGAPFKFKSKDSQENRLIHQLFYNKFSQLANLGYFHIIEHFMNKYSYSNTHIMSATLTSIISGKTECAKSLINILTQRNIDINYKFGILLNNTVSHNHTKPNNNSDFQIVEQLIHSGANTCACVTHPLITSVEHSSTNTIEYLFNRQLDLHCNHKDYLDEKNIKTLAANMVRRAVKRNDLDIINCVRKLIDPILEDTLEMDYIILKTKIRLNHPDIRNFAFDLSQDDKDFIEKTSTIGKKHNEFIKIRELIALHNKLYTYSNNIIKPTNIHNNKRKI